MRVEHLYLQFLDAITYSRWKALFSLLITTGMRPGEALALKWEDIDLKGGKVTVNRTLTRLGRGWRIEEPKTARSRRSIPLLPTVIKDLEEHKNAQEEEKSIAIAGKYEDHGFFLQVSLVSLWIKTISLIDILNLYLNNQVYL